MAASRPRLRSLSRQIWWRAVPLVIGMALGLAFAAPAPASAAPPPPRQQLTEKPSGFWTSNRPARGGAYRYRMLGIGVALAAITGLVTWRVIRRAGSTGRTPAPATSPPPAPPRA